MLSNKTRLFLTLAIFALSLLTAGCSGGTQGQTDHQNMAPLSEMPAEVQNAAVTVRQAYQFAVANPDVLTQIPCYCGCGAVGHASNYACYVAGVNSDGSIAFDAHALGCSICVDITLDTMRLLNEGQSVPQIRATIDQTYAQYGPSNMP